MKDILINTLTKKDIFEINEYLLTADIYTTYELMFNIVDKNVDATLNINVHKNVVDESACISYDFIKNYISKEYVTNFDIFISKIEIIDKLFDNIFDKNYNFDENKNIHNYVKYIEKYSSKYTNIIHFYAIHAAYLNMYENNYFKMKYDGLIAEN